MKGLKQWLDIVVVVLKVLLALLAPLAADAALFDGEVSDALRPLVALHDGPPLHGKPVSSSKSSDSPASVPVNPSALVKR